MGKSMEKCLTHRDTYNIINQYDDGRNRMLSKAPEASDFDRVNC